ncbi:MAG: exodeoxyribonuclease VII small subunit [Olsenella sp.]
MAETKYRDIEGMTFKEASVELEQIVRSLESGNLELEDSLDQYARGVEILKSLRTRLAEAEQKVRVLEQEAGPQDVTDTTAAPSTAFINE